MTKMVVVHPAQRGEGTTTPTKTPGSGTIPDDTSGNGPAGSIGSFLPQRLRSQLQIYLADSSMADDEKEKIIRQLSADYNMAIATAREHRREMARLHDKVEQLETENTDLRQKLELMQMELVELRLRLDRSAPP